MTSLGVLCNCYQDRGDSMHNYCMESPEDEASSNLSLSLSRSMMIKSAVN